MDKNRLTNIVLGVLVVGLIAYSFWSGRNDPAPAANYTIPATAAGIAGCDTAHRTRGFVDAFLVERATRPNAATTDVRQARAAALHEIVHVLQGRAYPGGCVPFENRRDTDKTFRVQVEIEADCMGSKSAAHCATMRKLKADGRWILQPLDHKQT